jgi:hypothetical protein
LQVEPAAYGQVLEHLHNDFIQDTNNSYPADVGAAYRLLSHWQQADLALTHGVPGDYWWHQI